MSYPKDRRHRFLISVNKGMKRVSTWNFGKSKEEQKKVLKIKLDGITIQQKDVDSGVVQIKENGKVLLDKN